MPGTDRRGLSVRVWSATDHAVTVPLGARPLYVGRAPTNDVVLDDVQVSGRHCALSATAGRAFVEDLASRNGTWLQERRMRRLQPWPPGERLRVGSHQLELVDGGAGCRPVLALREVASGLLVPLRGDRLRIGGPLADVAVDGPGEWTILVDPDGAAWLGSEDGSLEPLALGAELELGGRQWSLVVAPDTAGATADAASTPWPYTLRVSMSGPLGPTAAVDGGPHRVSWTAENRVVVWWLLARKLVDDRRRETPPDEAGWIDEQEVATGVWGRDGLVSNLGVLVTRIRHDLRRAELDPWFLERRRGHLRARVADVEVSG